MHLGPQSLHALAPRSSWTSGTSACQQGPGKTRFFPTSDLCSCPFSNSFPHISFPSFSLESIPSPRPFLIPIIHSSFCPVHIHTSNAAHFPVLCSQIFECFQCIVHQRQQNADQEAPSRHSSNGSIRNWIEIIQELWKTVNKSLQQPTKYTIKKRPLSKQWEKFCGSTTNPCPSFSQHDGDLCLEEAAAQPLVPSLKSEVAKQTSFAWISGKAKQQAVLMKDEGTLQTHRCLGPQMVYCMCPPIISCSRHLNQMFTWLTVNL